MSTIRDVARLAQVSTATVSRVINSPDSVREKTREKVLRAMKMCNYKYNALARGFATKKSNTIGLIIPNINNPVFAESTLGVQEYAEEKQIKVILGNTSYKISQEESLIKALRESQVDGLIITTTNPKGEIIKSLTDEGIPFVLLFSTVKNGPVSAVGVDNYRGGYVATEHLISLGHRRIGMIAGSFTVTDRSYHRWHGYRQCLKDHGLPYDKDLLVQTEYSLSGGRDSIKQLLKHGSPPSAVFCSNDYIALGAIKGAREAGLSLPEDLSIVGFDDMPTASYMVPALTTIRQPAYEMGRRACELLLQKMENPEKPEQHMMETKLIVRESTAAVQYDTEAEDGGDRQ
ncbi:LacI family DNA-binding transcriptional regulator [Maridesulfovibrio salexigens]|uniref:Transcriptional regulator, LacI family n=1 Tax=Maridesulfovibrio salexigens (strain ATCC 14822 / DSM 2638 / NCIMB 8403 / VKM B-1763) TaxID=526222 RepID=C6BWG6_MARSD|nr:LacI family DNA-binding transcriptional regulator [Maridesulfovibrio salexigens]ACS78410.1 transcriptional regulator, LacI family [Maridesulfovibrio salexigens DSM 2638]